MGIKRGRQGRRRGTEENDKEGHAGRGAVVLTQEGPHQAEILTKVHPAYVCALYVNRGLCS